jgi:ABC-2 type transport system permease protein
MRTIGFLIQKEFLQIFRNRTLLPIMFIAPIIQMLVLVFAANLNMKNIDFCVYDSDGSLTSTRLISKFKGSPFFVSSGEVSGFEQAEEMMKKGRVDMIINIPDGLEKDLFTDGSSEVQFLVDGINNASAVLISAYARNILLDFNKSLIPEISAINNAGHAPQSIDIVHNHWYNPELDFKIYMVPGILVILVTMVGWILAAFNIVREKELGTIEQINVTPIRKHHFIIGKLVPFWVIAMFELAFGLFLGKLIFHIPILGNMGLLFAFAGLYLLVALSIGLFISSVSQTQQQVMFVSFFFLLTFILMSGIFTPVESMPEWAGVFNQFNPIAYFMKVIRMIILKGSVFQDVAMDFLKIGMLGFIMLGLATWRYRKTA